MNTFKILRISVIVFSFLFISCEQVLIEDEFYENEVVQDYDLWYVDYNRTEGSDGTGEIPFLSRAFTLSFVNGILYANNNISGIGDSGNGYGINVGSYSLINGLVRTSHDVDGIHSFEVNIISQNEVKIYNAFTNTSYFLIGYDVDEFDYDKLFYENIEYLLQDYEVWNKKSTSTAGDVNEFDNENYLKFTSENNKTFYSSNNVFGTNVANINWNYVGDYEVLNVNGYEDLKMLKLDYDNAGTETFELSVTSDNIIELFHTASGTTYEFEGQFFIQYLKDKNLKKKSRSDRKRKIIKRKNIDKISY